MNITRFAIKGPYANDFGQTNNCGNSVATGANFSMAVLFTPSTTGARMATLSITDTASGSQTVSLSGTGTIPAAGLSRTNLSFASQSVGTTSTAQTTTLGNSGNATSNYKGVLSSRRCSPVGIACEGYSPSASNLSVSRNWTTLGNAMSQVDTGTFGQGSMAPMGHCQNV